MAAQKGPLWWAAHHRNHHQFADTERDTHSPQKGFWWSHVGWILCDKFGKSRHDKIRDFAKYPELRFLDKHDWIGPWTLGVVCYLVGGWSGLLIGFFASTVLLWHVDVHGQLARARVRPAARTTHPTRAGTRCSSRSRPAARDGTTTITATRSRRARASAGGRSTRPTTCCACSSAVGIVHDLRPVPAEVVAEAKRRA